MAVRNNNVESVSFLRNENIYSSRETARAALENNKGNAKDGNALLARYSGGTVGNSDFFIKTLVGYIASGGDDKFLTIFDNEEAVSDIILNVEERGFYFVDENGYVGAQLTEDGFKAIGLENTPTTIDY